MGVSCVYESCTNHRPQSKEAQKFRPLSETRPFFSGISSAQTTSLSAAAPSLHRFLAHIPEPQIRVPNSEHLPLIAGISSFSWLPFFLFPHSLSLLLLRQYRRVSARLSLFSPTHKRTEGRAPCGALSLLQKDAALQGGIQLKPL